MYKALYGTTSGEACWHDKLFDILHQMGSKPSKADPDMWMYNRILSKVQKSFWSCTHVNSCQKYTIYVNLHILLNI